MMREVALKENERITKCPKCGNNTKFKAYSIQCAEDCCDVWVACICGFDPTENKIGSRLEDVWGGTGNENVFAALEVWNDEIAISKESPDAKR
jgi:hypothetical protein